MTDIKVSFKPEDLDWNKVNGMMPAIVQNFRSGKVLMFAYMTREALDRTIETGKATFFSRTKNRLWTKGEESHNYLFVKALTTDCDSDTILVTAEPAGPTCHKGTESCFDAQPELPFAFLAELEDVAHAVDRGYDKMQKYIDAGRIDLDKTAVQGGRR